MDDGPLGVLHSQSRNQHDTMRDWPRGAREAGRGIGGGRVKARLCAFAVLALSIPAGLSAQICMGRPGLGTNSAGNVGVGASFFDGGKSLRAEASFGRKLFGMVDLTRYSYDDKSIGIVGQPVLELKDASETQVRGRVGYVVTVSRWSVCPEVQAGRSSGYSATVLGLEIDNTTRLTLSPGVSVGYSRQGVTPYAVARLEHVWTDWTTTGTVIEGSDTRGIIVLGVGLIGGRYSLRPSVSIPFGNDWGHTEYGVGFSVAVGGQG